MRVGLTGSFGSGKSTVARMFREKGARVLDADRIAHEVFRKGNPVYPKVRRLFRKELKHLSRAKMAEIVFTDANKRRRLESLIHPYVFKRIREEVAKTRRPVVVEVPLLFETGFDRRCDRTVTVVANKKKIFERLGRSYTPNEIRTRLRAQMPVAEKARRSDEVIDNSGDLKKTRQEVERLWRKWSEIIKGRQV